MGIFDYEVIQIDGDYAHLRNLDRPRHARRFYVVSSLEICENPGFSSKETAKNPSGEIRRKPVKFAHYA